MCQQFSHICHQTLFMELQAVTVFYGWSLFTTMFYWICPWLKVLVKGKQWLNMLKAFSFYTWNWNIHVSLLSYVNKGTLATNLTFLWSIREIQGLGKNNIWFMSCISTFCLFKSSITSENSEIVYFHCNEDKLQWGRCGYHSSVILYKGPT